MRRSPARPSPGQLATARQVASLLLGYPDEELLARLPLLRAAAAALPPAMGAPLGRFLTHAAGVPLGEQQADYVATFDFRRRCTLHLTYATCGDTRKRGLALLQVKHLYARAGMHLSGAELPDHLAVVLEFAAVGDPVRGERLLHQHRAGVELVRLALEEQGSVYAEVLHAVCATLPPLAADDRAAVLRLAQQGQPTEEVGLDPYGTEPFAPPEYMPPASALPTGPPA